MNVASNLEKTAFHFPERTAVIEGDKVISYALFKQDARRIASALNRRGIRPGDHVGLCAPNAYEWLAVYFGVLAAGAVAVSFSHLLTRAELAKILQDSKPKALLTADHRLADLIAIKNQAHPGLIVSDKGDISFDRLVAEGDAGFKIVDRHRHDTAAILYTGGTTGTPKGAMLSHANLQTSMFNVAHYERSTENDLALCFLPFNHVFAQVHITLATVYSGGGLIIQPSFDMKKAVAAIERHRITKFYAVPTIYIRLLELPDLAQKFRSVRYCFSAAASMAAEVVREWKTRTGLDIYESYGMTESAAMVTYNHEYRHVVGSVGTPIDLVEVQIRDSEGNRVEAGQQGEICICGPNITKGYLNHPAETRSAFWGNWFRSGDIGYFDADGYLYIVDRLKDMIITGGENVYPREVEEILYSHPDVLECAVVGLPDKEYGERVTAFIIPPKGRQPDPAKLKSFLKTLLAGFKVPKAFFIVDELPKSPAGKLLKREIKKRFR
ncbi:MAG: AMP-binding protein [Desulfobacterales bacterium]|jgi:long-chain acyl-CoA synthetase